MSEKKQPARPVTFFEQVKAALTHYNDPQWLGENSPLATPYFLGAALHGTTPAAAERGRVLVESIEKTLLSLWGDPLPTDSQTMLDDATESAAQGQAGRYHCLIIELNYRQRTFKPAPKSQSEIYNDILHISRPTHDRHLAQAVEAVATVLLQRLRPTFRLENPQLQRDLIGREELLTQILPELKNGKSVSLSGAGGVGKTSLGVAICEQWHSPATFWYTFRPTFNDQIESLLFALGQFLHQQGASTLWHQLLAEGGRIKDSQLAVGLARNDLAKVGHHPLLCFDEMDFLRPPTLDQPNTRHVQILEFIDSLRGHTPLLLIGQRPYWESEKLYRVDELSEPQLASLLTMLAIPASKDDLTRLHRYTGGNPRLVELCGALYWLNPQESFQTVLDQLPASAAILPLWHRLERRLPLEERRLLQALSVFRTAAPADVWQVEDDDASVALTQLLQRRLILPDEAGGITLLPALRQVIYDDLSLEVREQHHLQAASIRAERGEYTAAAYHLQQADQPSAALSLWFPQRRGEINRGQGSAALSIFEQVSQRRLSKKEAEQLALLRSELYELVGQPDKVVATLAAQAWSSDDALAIDAQIRWGTALQQQGRSDAALDKFSEGLQLQERLINQAVQLHTMRARTLLHQRDMQAVRHEVMLARYEVENLQGTFYDLNGNYEAAYQHYQAALALAEELKDGTALAHIQHHLALLKGRQSGLAEAKGFYQAAMEHYQQSGNAYRLEVVRSNLANTQIQSRHFESAVESASTALRFFQAIGDSVRIAQNASNLAEALVELDRLDEAEPYAIMVLEQEEPHSFPYALFTMGTLQRKRNQPQLAVRYYQQAHDVANRNEDHYLLAYTWEALGQIYKSEDNLAEARQALLQAEVLFLQLGIAEKVKQITILKEELDS